MSTSNPDVPALVDITARRGRRVRDQEGALLLEKFVLRGVPRTPYWLRLAADRDVKLTEHVPEPVAQPSPPAIDPPQPPVVLDPPAPAQAGQRQEALTAILSRSPR